MHLPTGQDGQAHVAADPLSVTLRGGARGLPYVLSVGLPLGTGQVRSCRAAEHPALAPHDVPVGRLLALLDSDAASPGVARAASVARVMLGPRRALAALDGWGSTWNAGPVPVIGERPCWTAEDLRLLAGEGRASSLARALVDAMPNLVRVTTPLLDGPLPPNLDSLGTVETVEACLRARLPWLAPDRDRLRRVLGLDWRFESLDVLGALVDLPPDWAPRDPAERGAFTDLVRGCHPLAARLGGYGFLRASRGRWEEYAATVARRLPVGVPLAAGLFPALQGACDMADALARRVMLPALALRRPEREAGLLHLGGARGHLRQVATAALFSGKGLPAILELSAAWHAGHARGEGARPQPGDRERWPVPFRPARAPNGVEIVFLGDEAALRAEGSPEALDGARGLGHCVPGYAPALAAGECAVASLRVPEGASFRRLSTAEISVERHDVRVLQHRGWANHAPPREADEALAWFVGRVASGALVPEPAYLDPGWRVDRFRCRSVEEHCGYPFRDPGRVEETFAPWRRFLPRPLRDLDVLCETEAARAFVEAAVAFPGPATVPASPASGPVSPPHRASDPFRAVRALYGTAAFAGPVPYAAGSILGVVLFGSGKGTMQANPGLAASLIVSYPEIGPHLPRLRDKACGIVGGASVQAFAGWGAWAALGQPGLAAFAVLGGAAVAAGAATWGRILPGWVAECRRAFGVRQVRSTLAREVAG